MDFGRSVLNEVCVYFFLLKQKNQRGFAFLMGTRKLWLWHNWNRLSVSSSVCFLFFRNFLAGEKLRVNSRSTTRRSAPRGTCVLTFPLAVSRIIMKPVRAQTTTKRHFFRAHILYPKTRPERQRASPRKFVVDIKIHSYVCIIYLHLFAEDREWPHGRASRLYSSLIL